MSLWIKVQNSFWSHRKTIRLRAIIGDAALWVPIRLWSFAAEHQADGVFSDYSPEELAISLGYQGDHEGLLQGLLKAGFMDPDPLRIHDWIEWNGFHETYAERARVASGAAKAKRDAVKTSPRPPSGQENRSEERRGEETRTPSRCPSRTPSRSNHNENPLTTEELAQDFGGEEPDQPAGQERRPVPANGKELFQRLKADMAKPDPKPKPQQNPGAQKPDPFPKVFVPVATESGTVANHPDLETVIKQFAGRFSRDQIKRAFLSFEAAKDANGNWFWGKKMCGDWRAAIECRINDDMDRRPSGNTAHSAEDILMKMSREGLK